MADVLVVISLGIARAGGLPPGDFLEQLLTELIQADQRAAFVPGALVDFQHIFHAGHERRICLGRDTPALLQPRFKFVFFN